MTEATNALPNTVNVFETGITLPGRYEAGLAAAVPCRLQLCAAFGIPASKNIWLLMSRVTVYAKLYFPSKRKINVNICFDRSAENFELLYIYYVFLTLNPLT